MILLTQTPLTSFIRSLTDTISDLFFSSLVHCVESFPPIVGLESTCQHKNTPEFVDNPLFMKNLQSIYTWNNFEITHLSKDIILTMRKENKDSNLN